MNKLYRPITVFFASMVLAVGSIAPAIADDTETLVGEVLYTGPSVTLIIDTSGSMGSKVLLNAESYDPNTSYTGPYNDSQKLFYTVTPGNAINYPDDSGVSLNTWIKPENFVCQSGLDTINTSGFVTDRFAQFLAGDSVGKWSFLVVAGAPADATITQGEDRLTECASDSGIHGYATGGADVYPISPSTLPATFNDSDVAWSSDPDDADAITWDLTGSNYTFYGNNFLNWISQNAAAFTPVIQTRLEIVQQVSQQLVTDLRLNSLTSKDDLKLGLMRFSTTNSGGMVVHAAADITATGVENALKTQIQAMEPSGKTPLAETMYEAKRYFAGEPMEYGGVATPLTSVAASHDANGYISPITGQCQKSYVVLLTDGQPVDDMEADVFIEPLTGTCSGSCLDELSVYMSNTDLGAGIPDTQSVLTYVIGFFTDSTLLKDTATGKVLYDALGNELDEPQDGYFLADNPEDLTNAFRAIFKNVASDVRSFTSPAVSVNSLNRLTNRDTLYFAMFEPSKKGQPHWDGNLKAYKIGNAPNSNDISILDKNSLVAVNSDGEFVTGSQSIWSLNPDEGIVTEGGVAARLSTSRNIYSNLSGSKLTTTDNKVSIANADLAGVNGLLTRTLMGVAPTTTDQDLGSLVNFAAGLSDDGSESRKTLGDPLHSQPLVVTYATGQSESLRVFFGTNDGYIHSIDPDPEIVNSADLEQFAFIPKELLKNLPVLKTNLPSGNPAGNKMYGMDGPITAWIDETDNNFVVNANEDIFLYAGMRRGGNSYYALKVSDPAAPELAFVINSNTTGFEKLGQTWSAATHAKIRLNNTEKDVIIFGGGYDPDQDDDNDPDTTGNAIYFADAKTGAKLWSISNSSANTIVAGMEYSIPSDVRAIDVDQDGLVDRLYVGDMGAKVWRVDINNFPPTGTPAITAGLLADLSGTGSSHERRFYSAPSVARFRDDNRSFYTVSLGSGFRAHPLDPTVDDRFYVIRDSNVYGPARVNGDIVYGDTEPDLLVEESDLTELDGTTPIDDGAFADGWMLKLKAASGEKSLSRALTVNGQILFTTYSPAPNTPTCDSSAARGVARLYAINVLTGLPVRFVDPISGEPVFSTELDQGGIQPGPQYIFTPVECDECTIHDAVSQGVIMDGTEVLPDYELHRPVKTYWYQNDAD